MIAIGLNPTRTLVLSQVVLSFGIPFALVPLVWFTARRDVMGPLVNRPLTTAVASVVAAAIVALNIVPARADRRALTAPAGVERAQRLGGRLPERADELRGSRRRSSLPGAVVELELLQRREGTVALLDQREPALVLGRRVEPVVRGRGSRRNGSATSSTRRDGESGAQNDCECAHARAGASRVTSRRCSRASGHSATSEPSRNTMPASQIRLTSGLTSTLKKTALRLRLEVGDHVEILRRAASRS